jgi:hypothetical protein
LPHLKRAVSRGILDLDDQPRGAALDRLSILAQARLSIAYGLGPISLVAGGALDAYISDDAQSPLILEHRARGPTMTTTHDVTVTKWPSVFVGVRL